LDLYFIL